MKRIQQLFTNNAVINWEYAGKPIHYGQVNSYLTAVKWGELMSWGWEAENVFAVLSSIR